MDKDLEEMGYVNIDPKSDFTSSKYNYVDHF